MVPLRHQTRGSSSLHPRVLSYRVAEGSPKTAPRGKIPYIEAQGESLSDSTFIIKRFIDDGLIPDLNARTAYGQGTGRLTDEEVTELREEVWESVGVLLAEARMRKKGDDGPFWALGGDEPTEVDATIFGFIVSSLICEA
ncbi:glutathione S-transferase [Fusarium bulbicola]|nr:glutathione S-transferase [Fusarium bulbicola]